MNTTAFWSWMIDHVPGLRWEVDRRLAAREDAVFSRCAHWLVPPAEPDPSSHDGVVVATVPVQRPPDVPRAAAAELDDDQVRREKRAQRLADAMQNDSAAKYMGGGR